MAERRVVVAVTRVRFPPDTPGMRCYGSIPLFQRGRAGSTPAILTKLVSTETGWVSHNNALTKGVVQRGGLAAWS